MAVVVVAEKVLVVPPPPPPIAVPVAALRPANHQHLLHRQRRVLELMRRHRQLRVVIVPLQIVIMAQ